MNNPSNRTILTIVIVIAVLILLATPVGLFILRMFNLGPGASGVPGDFGSIGPLARVGMLLIVLVGGAFLTLLALGIIALVLVLDRKGKLGSPQSPTTPLTPNEPLPVTGRPADPGYPLHASTDWTPEKAVPPFTEEIDEPEQPASPIMDEPIRRNSSLDDDLSTDYDERLASVSPERSQAVLPLSSDTDEPQSGMTTYDEDLEDSSMIDEPLSGMSIIDEEDELSDNIDEPLSGMTTYDEDLEDSSMIDEPLSGMSIIDEEDELTGNVDEPLSGLRTFDEDQDDLSTTDEPLSPDNLITDGSVHEINSYDEDTEPLSGLEPDDGMLSAAQSMDEPLDPIDLEHERPCPECGKTVQPDWNNCPYCGHQLM
jgi:hypothetical protein